MALTVVLVGWGASLTYLGLKPEPPTDRSAEGVTSIGSDRFRGNQLPQAIVGRPAPVFRLADARGGDVATGELRGRPYVVTFLYTDCTDTCPLIAAELRRTLDLLGPRSRDVAVLAVSADPKSDTRAAVRRWLMERRMPRNFHYLIGSRQELKPVWDAYYALPQRHDDPKSTHSASIWLVDARGRWRTKFSGGFPVPPADIAHDLRILLREAGAA